MIKTFMDCPSHNFTDVTGYDGITMEVISVRRFCNVRLVGNTLCCDLLDMKWCPMGYVK